MKNFAPVETRKRTMSVTIHKEEECTVISIRVASHYDTLKFKLEKFVVKVEGKLDNFHEESGSI